MDGLSLLKPIRQISEITDEPVQCLESLTEFLKVLGEITPKILDGIQPMVGLEEYHSASISLRYEHERSCIDLYRIGCDVVAIIEIVESLREMADDEERIEKIRAEVRNQIERGTTNFDGKNVACFPELNDFLTELLISVRKLHSLSQRIEKNYNIFSTRQEKAKNETENEQNVASWMNVIVGAVAEGIIGAATGGFGTMITGVADAVFDTVVTGGTSGIAKIYKDEEEKYCKTKERFKRLNAAALNFQDIICEIQQNAEPFKTVNVCFIHHQQLLLSQTLISLDKLFSALRFKGVNFRELRKRAESIY